MGVDLYFGFWNEDALSFRPADDWDFAEYASDLTGLDITVEHVRAYQALEREYVENLQDRDYGYVLWQLKRAMPEIAALDRLDGDICRAFRVGINTEHGRIDERAAIEEIVARAGFHVDGAKWIDVIYWA